MEIVLRYEINELYFLLFLVLFNLVTFDLVENMAGSLWRGDLQGGCWGIYYLIHYVRTVGSLFW